MKPMPACRPALALALAVAFALPASAQQAREQELADAICSVDIDIALPALKDFHGVRSDDDLTPKIRGRMALPPDIELMDVAMELPRVEARIQTTQAVIAILDGLDDAEEELNILRSKESVLQFSRGRPPLTSGNIAACECNNELKADLEADLSALKNLKAQLQKTRDRALAAACVAAVANATREEDQNVPAAKARLVRGTPDEPQGIGGWDVHDRKIVTPKPGEKLAWWGDYSWTAVPTSVGKDGFDVIITVRAHADQGQAFATGIAAHSDDGLLLTVGKEKPQKRIEVAVNPKNGDTETEAQGFTVKPPASMKPGQKYTPKIGAFWGPEVTYTFVAK